MKIKFVLLAAAFVLLSVLMSGCGGSGGGTSYNKYTGEYVYTSLDRNYKEYLYVERNGQFGIGYYALAGDGYYYRTAQLFGNVRSTGSFDNAYKDYDGGGRMTGIYGVFSFRYSDELWINMTEREPSTGRLITTDTQYFREYWRAEAGDKASGSSVLPEKIKAEDKDIKTCKKETQKD